MLMLVPIAIICVAIIYLYRINSSSNKSKQSNTKRKFFLTPTTIISIGFLLIIAALIYPPIHIKKVVRNHVQYTSAGNTWLPYLPDQAYIDWSILFIEILIIICIVGILYTRSMKPSLKGEDIPLEKAKLTYSPQALQHWNRYKLIHNHDSFKIDLLKSSNNIRIGLPFIQEIGESIFGPLLDIDTTKKADSNDNEVTIDFFVFEYGCVETRNANISLIATNKVGYINDRGIIIGHSYLNDVFEKYGPSSGNVSFADDGAVKYAYVIKNCEIIFTIKNGLVSEIYEAYIS